MENLDIQLKNYILFCETQKCLDPKTIRAYTIDISQFASHINCSDLGYITPKHIESYIAYLHSSFKPKSSKRKIASLKAFFHYCEFKEIINDNPFDKVEIRFREPIILPKTIPLKTLKSFLSTIYKQYASATTPYGKRKALRDIILQSLNFYFQLECAYPSYVISLLLTSIWMIISYLYMEKVQKSVKCK